MPRYIIEFENIGTGSRYFLVRPSSGRGRGGAPARAAKYGRVRDEAYSWATAEAAERNIPGRNLYDGDAVSGLRPQLDPHGPTVRVVPL